MKSVVDALQEAYSEQDIDSYIAILYNLKKGNTTIPLEWVSEILDFALEKGAKSQIDTLKLAIWHFFLLPTPKGVYPILTFLKREKKKCDNSYLKHILQLIGAPDDYRAKMEFDDMITGISNPNDMKALSLLLSYASSDLAKLFYEFVPSDYTPKPIRNAIMHSALDDFDKNCVDRFKWHRLRFDEIYSEFGNVSRQGLFALLFNHGRDINCKSFFWVVNECEPIQQLASVNTQMFYLKYLYYY